MEPLPLTINRMIRDNSHDLRLRVIAGADGLDRRITEKNIHRPGLLFAGFTAIFPSRRIQLIGVTEIKFLNQLDGPSRVPAIERLFEQSPPCVIVAHRSRVPSSMKELSERYGIPLISSSLSTNDIAYLLINYLSDKLSETASIHGTLVDVYGTGLLFVGRAGIGKSEIALDLVERGHRLVADDVVTLSLKPPGILVGTGPEMLKHLIEIRGVGVIDVREIFGVSAIRLQKRVEMVVELVDWDGSEDYERLGLEEHNREYLGMRIPLIKLPIYPGKNITVIAEAIALNLHLKVYGYNAARELDRKLRARLKNKQKITKYLRWDSE